MLTIFHVNFPSFDSVLDPIHLVAFLRSEMALIDLPCLDSSRESEMELRVQFAQCELGSSTLPNFPSRISGAAEDLADCDAASTCPSDSDSVILFDSLAQGMSFVCGSSVIFRNLHPKILTCDFVTWMDSIGICGEINCPSFQVQDATGSMREFNFGFCAVRLSSPEEAVSLNYLIHSLGLEELFSSKGTGEDEMSSGLFGSFSESAEKISLV